MVFSAVKQYLKNSLVKFVVAIVTLGVIGTAVAQSIDAEMTGSGIVGNGAAQERDAKPFDIKAGDMLKAILGKDSSLISSIKSNEANGKILDFSKKLLALIAIIMMGFGVIRYLTGGGIDDMASGFVQGAIIFSIPFWAINNWNGTMTSIFFDGMLGIAEMFGPLDIIKQVTDLFSAAVAASDAATSSQSLGPLDYISAKITGLVMMLLIGLGALIMVLGMFIAIQLPMIFMAIGMALGPILVVWLPFRPMANLALQWVQFMIANGMTVAVGSLLLSATKNVVRGIATNASQILAGANPVDFLATPFVSIVALAITMVVIGFILLQANNIAQGLTGGPALGGGLMEKLAGGAMAKPVVSTSKTATDGGARMTSSAGQKIGGMLSNKIAPAAGVAAESLAKRVGLSGSMAANIGTKVMSGADAAGRGLVKSGKIAQAGIERMADGKSLLNPKGRVG